MSDHDTLMVNFEIGDGPIPLRTTFKGGTWKARRRAKQAEKHRLTRRTYKQHKGVEEEELILPEKSSIVPKGSSLPNRLISLDTAERPLKKPRIEEESTKESDIQPQEVDYTHQTRKVGPIISSLFTSIPPKSVQIENPLDQLPPERPSNAPLPGGTSSFARLGLSNLLSAYLHDKMELKNPTEIQEIAVPRLTTDDADAFIQAETGSGKTLAYLLPVVQRILSFSKASVNKLNRNSGLYAIILAPTRELCHQISVVLDNLLGCARWVVAGTLMGGANKKHEKAKLRKGLNIMIATPGRLVDHMENTKNLDVTKICWLILDEGDRLMELGFEEDIRKIIQRIQRKSRSPNVSLPASRKITILCSATMQMGVQQLGEISLKDAVHLQSQSKVGKTETIPTDHKCFVAPAQLLQACAIVPSKQRLVTLFAVLKREFTTKSVSKTIVFFSCGDSVDFHFLALTLPSKIPLQSVTSLPAPSLSPTAKVFRLYGSLPAPLRNSTLLAFRNCQDPALLLSTDLSSRGIDLPKLDFVLELDPPFSLEDHMHRIGRTARAGASGRALIFLAPGSEEKYTTALQSSLGNLESGEARKLVRHDAETLLRKGFGSPGLGAGKDWEENASTWQLEVERWVEKVNGAQQMARQAFRSHIRAYATHTASEREVFNVKSLHLGHVAKGFGLREKPADIGRKTARDVKTQQRKVGDEDGGFAAQTEEEMEQARRQLYQGAMKAMDPKAGWNVA